MKFIFMLCLPIAFGAGIAHSALRFYFEYSETSERNKVISTVLLGSLAAASLGAVAMCLAVEEALFRPLGRSVLRRRGLAS